jgi:hypothetical protein
MGTNYYLHQKTALPEPDHEVILHIGKSSGGWCFSLHVMPELGINSLQDWIDLIEARTSAGLVVIKNEYDEEVSLQDLLNVITKRHGFASIDENFKKGSELMLPTWNYRDAEHFLDRNHAIRGPNNLLRHRNDGRLCIGHGEGTWDLCTGEFS